MLTSYVSTLTAERRSVLCDKSLEDASLSGKQIRSCFQVVFERLKPAEIRCNIRARQWLISSPKAGSLLAQHPELDHGAVNYRDPPPVRNRWQSKFSSAIRLPTKVNTDARQPLLRLVLSASARSKCLTSSRWADWGGPNEY